MIFVTIFEHTNPFLFIPSSNSHPSDPFGLRIIITCALANIIPGKRLEMGKQIDKPRIFFYHIFGQLHT